MELRDIYRKYWVANSVKSNNPFQKRYPRKRRFHLKKDKRKVIEKRDREEENEDYTLWIP